jgi:hypothetical protein
MKRERVKEIRKNTETVLILIIQIKGHGNDADSLGYCINWILIDPLRYLSSCSDFGFEFAEIFVKEKRLPDLPSRGVDKIA